jgi:hypothetical protein
MTFYFSKHLIENKFSEKVTVGLLQADAYSSFCD